MKQQSPYEFVRPARYDINKVFDCGQCFRFEKITGDAFEGVAFGKLITVSQTDEAITVSGFENADDAVRFLGLDIDYTDIEKDLSSRFPDCPAMIEALSVSEGVAILRQDPWETLVSFIISQNNNIPRIKGLIKALSEKAGDIIDENHYAFPTPEQTAACGVTELSAMKFGYRAPYIARAAEAVALGKANLEAARDLPTDELLEFLMNFHGVGPKVASCIALFSYSRYESFPVDVWIRRALKEFFPGYYPVDFGPYGGIAQQYLFYMQTHRK